MPRLLINEKLRVRQYIISDPATIFYTEYYSTLRGISSADWQQQMRVTPTQFCTSDLRSNGLDSTSYSIRPLPEILDYNPYYQDPDYGTDPYWDDHLYNQHHLYFYTNFNNSPLEIEPDWLAMDEVLNGTLTNASVDPWQTTPNPCALPAPLRQDNPLISFDQQVSLTTAVEARFANTLVTRLGEPDYVPLTTNLGLKYKRRMLYFPMDFGELTLDGLVDTGALSSAIPESDLRKIRLLAPQSIVKEGPAPNFQIMVANGQLETPKSTVELKFEVGDIEFHEIFIVMEKLTSPLIGLLFLQRNNNPGHASGSPKFPVFLHAIKNGGSQVHQRHGAYIYSGGHHNSP